MKISDYIKEIIELDSRVKQLKSSLRQEIYKVIDETVAELNEKHGVVADNTRVVTASWLVNRPWTAYPFKYQSKMLKEYLDKNGPEEIISVLEEMLQTKEPTVRLYIKSAGNPHIDKEFVAAVVDKLSRL